VTPENRQIIIETLCTLLTDATDSTIRIQAAQALGRLGAETSIPLLCQILRQDLDINVRLAIIDTFVVIHQSPSAQPMPEQPQNQPIFNINQVGNINTGDVTVTGDQIGIQHNYAPEQDFDTLLIDYKEFFNDLQQRYSTYPPKADLQPIIEVEFQEIQNTQPQRWQNFLNLKRLWNGGKKATFKMGEHFTEESLWGKMALAFLEGITEESE
jgi:hypothetical protein